MKKFKQLHDNIPSWLLVTAAVFVSLIFVVAISGLIFSEVYAQRIMPGVRVAGLAVGGKTVAEARQLFESRSDIFDNGLGLRFENKTIRTPLELAALSIDETLENAWLIGRGENWLDNGIEQVGALFGGVDLEMSTLIDSSALLQLLKKEFAEFEKPARNAGLEISGDDYTITEAEAGQSLEYEAAVSAISEHLKSFSPGEIIIASQVIKPEISKAEAERFSYDLAGFFNFKSTKLFYDKESWVLDMKIAKQMTGLAKKNGSIELALDKVKIKDFLEKEVVPKVAKEPLEARLTMENNRVSVWQAGEDGLEVELDESADRIALWKQDEPEQIEVAVKVIEGGAADATAQELGLKEIIGTGVSQFAGSPANRRHNIRVGANALHGLLIKPGEEFSLLKALGEIDAKAGYLPELVIKGNKTTPEYGGGLCQIGTTIFRATFNSGLPVTARRNHSYRVVYYEPAGTDATIYDPAPDYKFINDTGHHILIQARLAGDQLAFDIWGTKDGRSIEIGKPVIYNIVQPGPTKIIETSDLKEGERKCTERAHAGADAYFDYKVTYPNGEIKDVRFNSHYVPWQAVCLVGAKAAPEGGALPPAPSGTITPSVSPDVNQ
jgi:vancomycin resistance protein YoaR